MLTTLPLNPARGLSGFRVGGAISVLADEWADDRSGAESSIFG